MTFIRKVNFAIDGGGAAAVPPASAAAIPGVGPVLAPPSSVAFATPVVQAVAVSAGGVEEAPGRSFSRSGLWSFPVLGFFACLSVWFGRMIPGLYEVIQYTHSLSRVVS